MVNSRGHRQFVERFPAKDQSSRMNKYFVAWWNVENLFSIENDPNRHAWLERYLGGELAGWDAAVLAMKIAQLSSVITRMNEGQGPDLLGVCEIENKEVLEQLVAAIDLPHRKYRVVHHNTDDKRGIDVACIYDSKRLKTKTSEVFHHIIQKRTATRDLLQVNFCAEITSSRPKFPRPRMPPRLRSKP